MLAFPKRHSVPAVLSTSNCTLPMKELREFSFPHFVFYLGIWSHGSVAHDPVRYLQLHPYPLGGRSLGKDQDLYHPTPATHPILALPRLSPQPALLLQPNTLPLPVNFPHTHPLLPDVPGCIFIPAKATGTPFHDLKRTSVIFPSPAP